MVLLSSAVLCSVSAEARRIGFDQVVKLVTSEPKVSSGAITPLDEWQGWGLYRSREVFFSDPKNDYARWGTRQDEDFTELAVWRTTNGKAILGLNLVEDFPPQGCGDGPCGPKAFFVGFNGSQFISIQKDTKLIETACQGEGYDQLFYAYPRFSQSFRSAVQARFKAYQSKLISPKATATICLFPQHGTSITVALHPSFVAFAQRDKVLPLYYFKFDKTKGQFALSLQP